MPLFEWPAGSKVGNRWVIIYQNIINVDGGQALISRLYALLITIPIALLLLSGCNAGGPASPERGLDTLVGTALTSQQIEAAVMDLINNDAVIPGEISLRLVEGEEIDPIVEEWNLTLIDYKEFIDFYHFALEPGANLALTISEMRDDPRIEVAEPVYRTSMSALRVDPDDTRFVAGEQWYLENMDVPEAWIIQPGDPITSPEPLPEASDVAVAILDTGFDYDHPDLNPDPADVPNVMDNYRILAGKDFVNGDSDPQDDNGHGTMVAGIIGAQTNNAEGIAAVSWNARIIPVKVLDQEGNGTSVMTADGIWYAVSTFMDKKNALDPFDPEGTLFSNPFNARLIINMSFTYLTPNSLGPSQMELNAVEYAIDHGALLVAAAGDGARPLNNGTNSIYPASYPGVIAVGATDQVNQLCPNTNSLPLTANPATAAFFVAPGKDMVSTMPMDFSQGYGVGSGTSFSAACLSGVAALIWAQFPFIAPADVIETLAKGADSNIVGSLGADHVSGRGLINALDSLQTNFVPNPTENPIIVRAFTNPILHGDIIFVIRSHYRLMSATDQVGVNNGYPFRYAIGWDFDLDGIIDYEFPYVNILDQNYWRHEIYFTQIDSATFIGRVHFPQDLTEALTPETHPMGQLVIEFIGVPFNAQWNSSLPETVSGSTVIQIDEFNYDLPG